MLDRLVAELTLDRSFAFDTALAECFNDLHDGVLLDDFLGFSLRNLLFNDDLGVLFL